MLDRERGLEKDGLAEIKLFDRAHPDTAWFLLSLNLLAGFTNLNQENYEICLKVKVIATWEI